MNNQSNNNAPKGKRFHKYHHRKKRPGFQNRGPSQNSSSTQSPQKDSLSDSKSSATDNRRPNFKKNNHYNKQSGRQKEAQTINTRRDHNPQRSNKANPHPHAKGIRRYDFLFDQYLSLRKKYFETFYKAKAHEKEKTLRLYNNALKALRDFERHLNPHERELFEKHFIKFPLDNDYSHASNLNPQAERVPFSMTFDDPHVLESQKKCDYSNDTEESVGPIEDYKKYKGL